MATDAKPTTPAKTAAARRGAAAKKAAAKKPAAKKPSAKKAATKKPSTRPAVAPADPSVAADQGGAERRQHRRAALNLLVQHRFESLQAFIEEVATDLSSGGMFLRTDKPHAVDSTIYLRFTLDDGLPLIEGIGKVVWANARAKGRPQGMGIEFVSLDDQSRKLIDSILAERFRSEDASTAETTPAEAEHGQD